ncbi:MAG: DUF2190 family protein, partial [Bacteroidia bacterium]
MAKNLIACGDVFDYTAGATIASGDPVLVGELLGVALVGGVSGDVIPVQVEGVFEIAKRTHASSAAMAQGSKLYWDATNSRIDNTDNSAANKHIGYAYKAAAS